MMKILKQINVGFTLVNKGKGNRFWRMKMVEVKAPLFFRFVFKCLVMDK